MPTMDPVISRNAFVEADRARPDQIAATMPVRDERVVAAAVHPVRPPDGDHISGIIERQRAGVEGGGFHLEGGGFSSKRIAWREVVQEPGRRPAWRFATLLSR